MGFALSVPSYAHGFQSGSSPFGCASFHHGAIIRRPPAGTGRHSSPGLASGLNSHRTSGVLRCTLLALPTVCVLPTSSTAASISARRRLLPLCRFPFQHFYCWCRWGYFSLLLVGASPVAYFTRCLNPLSVTLRPRGRLAASGSAVRPPGRAGFVAMPFYSTSSSAATSSCLGAHQ